MLFLSDWIGVRRVTATTLRRRNGFATKINYENFARIYNVAFS